MAGVEAPSLRVHVADAPGPRFFWDRGRSARFTDLARGTCLDGQPAGLTGRSVLLATAGQLTTALALVELDGYARRVVILPPDIDESHIRAVATAAEIDAMVYDAGSPRYPGLDLPVRVACAPSIVARDAVAAPSHRTEWVLVTSGTTGVPKMVVHDLAGLTAPLHAASAADGAAVWATFYDIRRYGGLQILLRAILGGASLVLSNADDTVADHLARLAAHGITHLSGTPSQWRRALMNPAIDKIAPRYVRLSGEIADQAILDSLRRAFARAAIGHAYASTEAGVAFEVDDGEAGFPAAYVDAVRDGVEMKVVDGSLRVRSPRTASRYLNTGRSLADADRFVDTGDIVERRADRYYFVGRKGGIINIGGLKVHPEEIEAVINRHPRVRMSLVRGKQSPITGSIVVADVVLTSEQPRGGAEQVEVRNGILKLCREALPRHKVPAAISFVPALNVGAAGKLARRQG
jgi:acyl-coenzyme A synthetase/AMP-(fatty) acid ligase